MKRSPEEDLALVARAKRELPRHHEAFEELVRAYQSRIYTICYRLSGNPEDAKDLLQEVLVRLFLGINSFQGDSKFSTWVFRVAYNHCLNAIAQKKRGANRSEELLFEPSDPKTQAPPRQGRAQAVLNHLSDGDRSLLVMKYVTELDVQEIASILGLSVSAVKMRLLRAREAFKARYRES